jgi:hypothetical protein
MNKLPLTIALMIAALLWVAHLSLVQTAVTVCDLTPDRSPYDAYL